MSSAGGPSFGTGRLCGLARISDDSAQVSLFDGFDASFGDELAECIEETQKERNMEEKVLLSANEHAENTGPVELSEKESVPEGGQIGEGQEIGRTNDSPLDEAYDDERDCREEEMGKTNDSLLDEACGDERGCGRVHQPALNLASSDEPTQVHQRTVPELANVILDSPPPPRAQTAQLSDALGSTQVQPPSVATEPTAPFNPSTIRVPFRKRVTFNLEKNEVRIFSPRDDGPQLASVQARTGPLLKRKRWEISRVAVKEATGNMGNNIFPDHLEHLLSVEMAVQMAQGNFERLFLRMQDTVKALSMEGA